MPIFRYIQQLADGTLTRGTLDARDDIDARQQLATKNIQVAHLEKVEEEKKKKSLLSFFRLGGVSLSERALFTQNLAVLVRSGVPIAQGLGTLGEQTRNAKFKAVILDLKDSIERGEGFSKTMEKHPKTFSEVYVAMIAAGEASGKLELILEQLARQMKKERTLIAKVRSALTYPIIVIIAMIGLGIGMMLFVIPKITDIYDQIGGKLPTPTRVLISISDFLVHNTILVVVLFIGLLLLLRYIYGTKRGKRIAHQLLLRTPIAAGIIKKIQIARFTRTLQSLLTTDIPIVQSLAIIERTLSNVLYREAMAEARESLKKGSSIVEALSKHPSLFPPLVLQMISVGETSGRLDELTGHIAIFYEEDVDETMASFSSIIEPVLMLILGVGVAGMAVAILLPMYSLTENI